MVCLEEDSECRAKVMKEREHGMTRGIMSWRSQAKGNRAVNGEFLLHRACPVRGPQLARVQ